MEKRAVYIITKIIEVVHTEECEESDDLKYGKKEFLKDLVLVSKENKTPNRSQLQKNDCD